MAVPNRFAIRDAGEATFYDLIEQKPIVTLRTLKTSGVETTGETVYARGGRGNAKILGFSGNRDSRITLEDAIFDKEAIAMLTGNPIENGKQIIHFNEKLVVAEGLTVAVTKGTPKAVSAVFSVLPDGTNGDEVTFTLEGKNLTLTGAQKDDTVIVYYTAETDETAKRMNVTTDAFGGTFKIVLDVLVREEHTKKDYAAQLVIPNGKFEDNFNMDFSAEGDPAVLTLPIEIMKDSNSTDMWSLIIFDDEAMV